MSRQNKKILKITQRYVFLFLEKLRFKTSHISVGGKIALMGVVISSLSLFLSWISPFNTISSCEGTNIPNVSSFSPLLGGIGFFILIIISIITFSIVSIEKKEKIRFLSHLQFSDSLWTFWGAISIFFLSIHSFILISGLQFFSICIFYGQGVILSITGSIIIFIGSIIIKKDSRKNIKGSYISEIQSGQTHEDTTKVKNNMKLPF